MTWAIFSKIVTLVESQSSSCTTEWSSTRTTPLPTNLVRSPWLVRGDHKPRQKPWVGSWRPQTSSDALGWFVETTNLVRRPWLVRGDHKPRQTPLVGSWRPQTSSRPLGWFVETTNLIRRPGLVRGATNLGSSFLVSGSISHEPRRKWQESIPRHFSRPTVLTTALRSPIQKAQSAVASLLVRAVLFCMAAVPFCRYLIINRPLILVQFASFLS